MHRRRHFRTILSIVALLVAATPVAAESSGWTVLTTTGQFEDLTLLSVRHDTLLCELSTWEQETSAGRSAFLRIPVSEIVRIERSHGSRVFTGMGIGLLAGGGLGAAIGSGATGDMAGLGAAIATIGGTAAGFLIGTVVGAAGSGSEEITLLDFRIEARPGILEYVIINDAVPEL